MLRSALVAACAVACAILSSSAEARSLRVVAACDNVDVMRPCAYQPDFMAGVRSIRVTLQRERHARRRNVPIARSFGAAAAVVTRAQAAVGGIVAPLAAKVAEIQSSCSSRVISGVRHTYVAGTRRISLHASGKAVDMAGSPGCIYAHLAGWAGGYSVDYGRVRHVHISWDPEGRREWGVHFAHGGHRHRGHRYAHRHHRQRTAGLR